MRSKLLRTLRSLAAIVAGYLVIVAGTTLTFETILGGIGYYESSPTELAWATLGALLSGFAGGLVAAWLGGRRPFLHAAGLLVPLAVDTAYVVFSGISSDPVWFDLGGSATLVVGALLGGYVVEKMKASRAGAGSAVESSP